MSHSIPSRAAVTIRAHEDGSYSVVARVTWSNGVVSVDGEPNMVADLNDGIEHPLLRTRTVPADGFRFLVAVLNQFQSPYLLATLEEEDISNES